VVRDFLGGAATMTASLREREDDPLITGRFQVTGLDTRRLTPGAEEEENREAEVNAVGDLRWRLRDVSGPRLLEELGVTLDTTHIGRIAMVRLLQSLDAEGQNPAIQNAVTAVRLGTPVGAEGTMNTSLVSLESELLLPFGFRVNLPIVDRQPVSELVEVYNLQEASQAGITLRWFLTLLLSDTLDEFENKLQGGAGP